MKKLSILIGIFLLHSFMNLQAQNQVNFEFSDGISNEAVKSRMERQVMNLLTAINTAESRHSDINFSGIQIDDLASSSICMLWNNVHFRCLDDDIVEHCLSRKAGGRLKGYQVRNIAIKMKPVDNTYTDDLNQEVCIDFDTDGRITDFNITMGTKQYARLMKEGMELDDVDKRMQIIHFCEQFRTAYNQKDIQFMEDIFSEDALIITGKVTQRVPSEIGIPDRVKVEYNVQGKQQYLANLRRVFARQGYINVKFNDYRIKRDGAKPNYYGVTLIQEWNSSTYSDKGIVFLVWDFADENAPKIHVRTWQPTETSEDEIFTLNKFKLR